MLMATCRCGPRPQHFSGYIADAKRAARFDPTGTLDIRSAFRRQMDSRWSKLRRLALEAIDRNDMLGLAGVTHRSIMVASQTVNVEQIYPGSDKVKAFQSWIDAAMSQVILGDAFGSWTSNFIVRAAERATERAEKLTGGSFNNDLNRIRALSSLTVVELQGVMEAVSQQAVRAFTQGMLSKQRPSQVARSVSAVINAIGTVRGRMVAETMVIKTFTAVTADAFRAAGITHIGTTPERIKAKAPIGDAARKTKQARGPGGKFRSYTKMPSAKKIREIIKREQELSKLELVEVLTAGDDDVCPICEDISDDGPYEIDEAEDLIPAHPNAVLEGSTIASYGAMHEMVRARFSGPAIFLRTRSKTLTIGPNHPMLTRRGFIKARDLRKGDELLYDNRTDWDIPRGCGLSHFEQMPTVEDAFKTLALVSGSSSRAARPHDDLHGDAVSCEGEVEIVHPARNLLPVLDPLGIEKFSEFTFALSDTNLEFIAALRARQADNDTILLPTSSGVSASNLLHSSFVSPGRSFDALLFGSGSKDGSSFSQNARNNSSATAKLLCKSQDAHAARVERDDFSEPIFRWIPVLEVHEREFSGWAFDATTASALYNSDGFVVHNCRCALVPVFDERFASVRNDSAIDFNPYHEPAGTSEGGQFAASATGSTDPNAEGHQSWVKEFTEWATTHAFGPSTVNSSALRAHMHENNREVIAAAARVRETQSKVSEFFGALPYKATPFEVEQANTAAKKHLRQVESAARKALGLTKSLLHRDDSASDAGFDPNQPRDDEGQWTTIGGGTPDEHIVTHAGEKFKPLPGEKPNWSDYHKQYYVWGYRWVKTKQAWSGQGALHNFKPKK